MADDLMRFLSGFPVRAREGLRMYRARKFVRRHWLAVTATAGLMVVLAASAAILTHLQAETARQRNLASAAAARAETEAENAGLVIEFLADVFRSGDPSQAPNDTLTARGLVEWGAQRVDSEFTDRPAVQARLLLVLGEAHENLGLPEEGAQLMQKALVLRRRLFGEESEETAEALFRLAELQHAAREISLAIPLYEEALHVRRSVSHGDERALAPILSGLELALAQEERTDSAELLLREAVAILSPYLGDEASISASLDLAQVLRFAGKLEEAASLYEEGIPRYRALPGHNVTSLAKYLNNLAYLRRVQGDFAGAEPLYRESLGLCTQLYGRGHPTTLTVASNLAGVLTLLERRGDGIAILRQSLEAAEAQWPEGGWRVTSARRSLGDALLRAGKIAEAEPVLRAAALEFQDELGPQHEWTSFALARVAVIRALTADPEVSRTFMDRLHGWLSEQRDDAGGSLPPATVHQLTALLAVLDDVGLEEEYDRFSELLGKRSAGGGGDVVPFSNPTFDGVLGGAPAQSPGSQPG